MQLALLPPSRSAGASGIKGGQVEASLAAVYTGVAEARANNATHAASNAAVAGLKISSASRLFGALLKRGAMSA